MRRKSARNAQKATPEKSAKEVEPPKTRRSRRRKRSPSKSSESEEEVLTVTKRAPVEETPDTTTKSHTPSDDETSEEPMWKVTSTEETPKGEIQKLRISLTRPSPDSPDKSKTRRSKSNSQTEDDATSSEDKSSTRRTRSRGSPFVKSDGFASQGDEEAEEKKGKGKSKGKHKSKIEKSPQLSEPEVKPNSEISENVQVTPQSPSIDKRVDNENDYKVDVHDKQSVNDSQENVGEESESNDRGSRNERIPPNDGQRDSDDDQPLSVIQKIATEKQKVDEPDQHLAESEETVTNIEQADVEESKETTVAEENRLVDDTKVTVEHSDCIDTELTVVQANVEKIQSPEKVTEVVEQTTDTTSMDYTVVSEQDYSLDTTMEEATVKTVEEAVVETIEEATVQTIEEATVEEAIVQTIEEATVEEAIVETVEEATLDAVEETVIKTVEVIETQSAQIKDQASLEVSSEIKECAEQEQYQQNDSPEILPQQLTETQISAEAPEEITRSSETMSQPVDEQVPRRRLKRDNSCINASPAAENEEIVSGHIKPSRIKRDWTMNSSSSSLIKVDLESVQVVCPSIDFPEEPDLNLEIAIKERRRSSTDTLARKLERKVSVEYKSDSSDRPSYEKQTSVGSETQSGEDNANIIAFNRKISIVDDTASKLKPPPSPAKNPSSSILYITNLVRPFTLKQLKELLERTGKIVEEGFWTDRIKSKCYVHYESQEEAEATRNALHGVQWPIGNGKKLIIDFATEEELNNAKNPPAPPPSTTTVAETKITAKENVEPMHIEERSEEDKASKEMEKKRSEGPVREWDIGKKELRKERSRSRDRNRKNRRSPSPSDFISRKQRKVDESVPQKLMDDLFLKTKATPSIYWQPLSPEEIALKQQQRLIRMEEHKRRIEENTRMKGREMGRGAFRRRYD